jgi:uncharacterized protein (TIGR03118 family)
MRQRVLRRGTALVIGAAASVVWASAGPAAADHSRGHDDHGRGAYAATPLVTDTGAGGTFADSNLINPWGIAFGTGATPTPLWVSNNGTSTSTLYRTDMGAPVTKVPLIVSTQPLPTGVAFNSTTGFPMADGTTHSLFLFDSLSGQISAWAGGTHTTTIVTIPGAVYTGLAVTNTSNGPRLFAADSASTVVQVFNSSWDIVGVLSDPRLPTGLSPYNVAVLGNKVYVTYAPPPGVNADVSGAIDVYSLGGRLERRFATGGVLEGPWGLALAPKNWGRFGGALLVGNEDGGRIHAFDPHSGHFLGTVRDANGNPIGEDGLWGMAFGNGIIGTPNDLVVVIGTDEYTHGIVELVDPVKAQHKQH